MKKIILSLLVATSLFGCQSKTENTGNASVSANSTGYNVSSSDNITLVKKVLDAGINDDTATIKATYVDSAFVFDNKTKQTLSENMQTASYLKSKQTTVKIVSIDNIWESVLNKEDKKGATSYVHVYLEAAFTRAGKTVSVELNVVYAIKNGKILGEWDIYDTAELRDLLK
jgi:hypothetical protein